MNRQEFEHIIRACAKATGAGEFLVIGSQSILGSIPDAPKELRMSMELDVCPLPFNESTAALIDGNIGELTRFHETFRVYAHAVAPETATLPADFRQRLVELGIGGARVHCLAPIDLAYSKLVAGRQKDLGFLEGLLHYKIVRRVELQKLIAVSEPELRPTLEDRLKIAIAKLERRRAAARDPGRGTRRQGDLDKERDQPLRIRRRPPERADRTLDKDHKLNPER